MLRDIVGTPQRHGTATSTISSMGRARSSARHFMMEALDAAIVNKKRVAQKQTSLEEWFGRRARPGPGCGWIRHTISEMPAEFADVRPSVKHHRPGAVHPRHGAAQPRPPCRSATELPSTGLQAIGLGSNSKKKMPKLCQQINGKNQQDQGTLRMRMSTSFFHLALRHCFCLK